MAERTRPCDWIYEGQILGVRVLEADGTSHGGFANATAAGAVVEAPDWEPTRQCGHGIHFWPWGLGREGKDHAGAERLWQVVFVAPGAAVDLGGKAKAPRVTVVWTGPDQAQAMARTHAGRMAFIAGQADASGNASTAATSGWQSSAATSGEQSSAATSGWQSSAATSGVCAPAVCAGLDSRAKAGPYGCVALAWWNAAAGRAEMRCGEVGCGDGSDGRLRAHVWYRVDADGRLVEAVVGPHESAEGAHE